MIPGGPNSPTTRYETSLEPFDVPPESTTTSHSATARRKTSRSLSRSSGTMPYGAGSDPSSLDHVGKHSCVAIEHAPDGKFAPRVPEFVAS